MAEPRDTEGASTHRGAGGKLWVLQAALSVLGRLPGTEQMQAKSRGMDGGQILPMYKLGTGRNEVWV